MWFEELWGFKEVHPAQVRSEIFQLKDHLISRANGRKLHFGWLEMPTLEEIREQVIKYAPPSGTLQVSEVVADVQALHADKKNARSVFQVASQFNLLEMVSPSVTPEMGIDRYASDLTQGPACAIAAGAATVYRNYFVEVGGRIGQSKDVQIDCLSGIGEALKNQELGLWEMRNGYALATESGLNHINEKLAGMSAEEREHLKGLLKVGVQWDAQVTLKGCEHKVNQVFCSALPVAYSQVSASNWEPFARLILEAAYEATLGIAAVNYAKTRNANCYLTLLGGGAFGNRSEWIIEAMEVALDRFKESPLEVKVVSYGGKHPGLAGLLGR